MLYYLFLHDYSASEYAESIGQSDRNIRGIRNTALKKIGNFMVSYSHTDKKITCRSHLMKDIS